MIRGITGSKLNWGVALSVIALSWQTTAFAQPIATAAPSSSPSPDKAAKKSKSDKADKADKASKSDKGSKAGTAPATPPAAGAPVTTAPASPSTQPAKRSVKPDSGATPGPDKARRLFIEAEQAFSAADYPKAIELFRRVDELSPKAELEYNIALAYEGLGDKAGALEAYRAYLNRAPTSPDRAEVEANVARLSRELGKEQRQQITVVTEPAGATVLVDAQPAGITPWTGELATGRHQLVAKRVGHLDAMRGVSLGAEQPLEVTLVLKSDPALQAAEQARLSKQRLLQAERDRPTGLQKIQPITWGLVGAGAAGLIGAGAFEQARANSEDNARLAQTQVAAESELDSAESQQTTARILLGVGAGAMVLGGVFLYIDLSREPDSVAQLKAGCTSRRCGIYTSGQF